MCPQAVALPPPPLLMQPSWWCCQQVDETHGAVDGIRNAIVINVRSSKASRSMPSRPRTAATLQRNDHRINATEARSASDPSDSNALRERQSHRHVAKSTLDARSRAFEWNQNGVRQFAVNAPAKQIVKVLPHGQSSDSTLELELVSTRWRPVTARNAPMHMHNARVGREEQASRKRPQTARDRPSRDLRLSVGGQRIIA